VSHDRRVVAGSSPGHRHLDERGDDAAMSQPPAAVRPCRYPARAWWGDVLVAESRAALRAEGDGGAPTLWFPCRDIRFDLLRPGGRDGDVELWDAEGPVPEPRATGWFDGGPVAGDGRGVLRRPAAPAAGCEALVDHAAFDHDRVRVELVDTVNGDDPRDVTVKRFPTWGDVADLVDVMDVRPDGDGGYVGVAVADHRRSVVEASQMLGQAVVAAGRHAPGRRVVSAHLVAFRAADARAPLAFAVDELSAGRTFTTLLVHVAQGDRRCATVTLLLGAPAADVVRHAASAPEVAGPYDAVPHDMSVTGRDLRVVDAAYTDDPDAPIGPPVLDAWVRFRDLPDDQALHAGLLAQFTGHMSIAAALRPHAGVGQRQAHRTLSTAINAIGISFHADVRADRWLLYHHLSTAAADGMTHAECRVHGEAGDLVASFTVDAMVRPLGHPTRDARTAL
jgi:acyl-CoA thioesterase II